MLEKAEGLSCWSVVGPSAGSWFRLDLGKKVERKSPIDNPHLNVDQRRFIGEYGLLVLMCGWCIFQNKEKICDCNDSQNRMKDAFQIFVGKSIAGFKFGPASPDLLIKFSEGIELFLVRQDGTEASEVVYKLSGPDYSLSVSMDGTLSKRALGEGE